MFDPFVTWLCVLVKFSQQHSVTTNRARTDKLSDIFISDRLNWQRLQTLDTAMAEYTVVTTNGYPGAAIC